MVRIQLPRETANMGHRLLIVALLLLGGVGCRACGSGCYDYLPPVADGPYTSQSGRAGSAFGNAGNYEVAEIPDPAVEAAGLEEDSELSENEG